VKFEVNKVQIDNIQSGMLICECGKPLTTVWGTNTYFRDKEIHLRLTCEGGCDWKLIVNWEDERVRFWVSRDW